MKFEEMNIEKSVLGSLNDIGFENPTRIQFETIPLIKQGHDVIGQSETGSGKTAAFGIPLVEKVLKDFGLQAIVLAPTRELSKQIANELSKFSRFKKLYIQTVYGGVSIEPQISGLKKAEIVVGTPGRIIDHMKRKTLDAKNLKIFVLDEADKMLDMGFIDDIQEIERNIPKKRQTLLFSATMSIDLKDVVNRFTKDAKKIKTETKVREDFLKQYYCDVDQNRKFSLLVHLINTENPKLAIIFCNTKHETEIISRNLYKNGIENSAFHGGLTQQRREKIIERFHNGTTNILVATDVAARGLDIKNVTHILNYSIPRNSEDYVNRIGRTARAGESGKAITLLNREDHESFRRIINIFSFEIKKLNFSELKILPFYKESYRENRYKTSNGFSGRRFFRRKFR